MDDFNIEIYDEPPAGEKIPGVLLPVNYEPLGEISPGSISVYIKQDVYKKIEKYSSEDISKEVGSILLGSYNEGEDGISVVISAYIEAKYTDASSATLTFTHKTWEDVYKKKDEMYGELSIVGWHHTHPGYGIFLSNYDVFIQENFFNLPWQIAYVVDPIAKKRGFFEWKKEKPQKMSGFYVYDDAGKQINTAFKEKPKGKNPGIITIIVSFLLLISAILNFSFVQEKQNLREELGSMKKQASQAQIVADEKKEYNAADMVSFRLYEIKSGDSLEAICKKYGIDFEKNLAIIKRINSISDINKIYAGEKLFLPIN